MSKRISPEAAALAEQARLIFCELQERDPKTWNSSHVAKIINSVTQRNMDSSAARRFLMANPDRPTVLSLVEATKVLQSATMARAEFETKLSGQNDVPALRVDFIHSVNLKIDIPLTPELYEKIHKNLAFQEFIQDTVKNALALIDRTTKLDPH